MSNTTQPDDIRPHSIAGATIGKRLHDVHGRGDLWRECFKIRKRPITIVTAMVGMFVIAAHTRGRRPSLWASVPGSRASIQRFVGAARGYTFAKRFDDLEAAGLISRKCGLTIAPPSKWVVKPARQTTRANECPPMERLPDHVLEAMAAAYESEMGCGA